MSQRSRKRRRIGLVTLALVAGCIVLGPSAVRLMRGDARRFEWAGRWRREYPLSAAAPVRRATRQEPVAGLILQGARDRARRGAQYDASYRQIPYPMGDVPDGRGACSDVIVRSLRRAGIDLQQLIHQDMRWNFSEYPSLWGLSKPDANIDHRRTPNQMCYLRRHWLSLGTELDPRRRADWQGGDLVYWRLGEGVLHCGVVTDRIGPSGWPMVIHNISRCREEDVLSSWEIIAHFRHPSGD